MQDRFFQRLLFVLIAVTVLAPAQEPVKPKLNPRIITATRQVQTFINLEMQMLRTIQKKDKAGLQAMLTEEFQVEMPDADLTPAEDWVDSVMAKDFTLKSFGIREMSVVDLGTAAVVKFERSQEAIHKGNADNGEFFVVDLWKKDGDNWKLANRYVAKISSVVPNQANRQELVHPSARLAGKRCFTSDLLLRNSVTSCPASFLAGVGDQIASAAAAAPCADRKGEIVAPGGLAAEHGRGLKDEDGNLVLAHLVDQLRPGLLLRVHQVAADQLERRVLGQLRLIEGKGKLALIPRLYRMPVFREHVQVAGSQHRHVLVHQPGDRRNRLPFAARARSPSAASNTRVSG